MKKALLIAIAVGAVVSAYLVGHSCGRSSGFDDGAVWCGRSADRGTAMRDIVILGLLEQTNYTRVAESLNHHIDYAILEILVADKYLADVRLPHHIQEQDRHIRAAFKATGTTEETGYRHLADFRRQHPTEATDKDVLEAVNQLLEEH